MFSTYFEITEAQQTRMHNIYKNTKLKLIKTIATISYNKMFKAKQLTPIYIHIRFNGNNIQSKKTGLMATKYRITQQIKFLYCKKQIKRTIL